MLPLILLGLVLGGLYVHSHRTAATGGAGEALSQEDKLAYTNAMYSGDPVQIWLESVNLEQSGHDAEAAYLRQYALQSVGWNAPVDILAEIPDVNAGTQFLTAMKRCDTTILGTLAAHYLDAPSTAALQSWIAAGCGTGTAQAQSSGFGRYR